MTGVLTVTDIDRACGMLADNGIRPTTAVMSRRAFDDLGFTSVADAEAALGLTVIVTEDGE